MTIDLTYKDKVVISMGNYVADILEDAMNNMEG